MSIGDEPPGLAAIASRLRSALVKARELKKGASVEPPLAEADFREDVSQIASAGSDQVTPTSLPQHMALETAARSILYDRLASTAIRDTDFVEVWNLLDIVQLCADHGQCEAGLTLWLIEELLDSQTIDGCRAVFDYLESRCERLVGAELTQNKRNTILRTCNELLHRLSRAEDAVFCGRVFIFLFNIFPLGDKSAVNLRGEFHIENTTSFDAAVASPPTDRMEVDEAQAAGNTSSANNVDNSAGDEGMQKTQPEAIASQKSTNGQQTTEVDLETLYPIFWSLQHNFSNPPRIFQDGEFERFKTGLEVTLRKFKSVTKVPTKHSAQSAATKRKLAGDDADLASLFNPKYLTSKDLFKLEMSDITFQRHILVQSLILIDFVLSLTVQAKKKNEDLKAQRAMVYSYTLSEENTKWAAGMRAQIGQYLRGDLEGQLYHRMVDTVLSRDKNWVRWKIESCPPISKPALSLESYDQARSGTKRVCTSRRIKPRTLGSLDLGFLSDEKSTSSMDMLRSEERSQIPSMDSMVREVTGAQLDLEMVDKATEPKEWTQGVNTRASKTWRALRLASKTRLAAFAEIDEAEGLDRLVETGEKPSTDDGGLELAGDEATGKEPEEAAAAAEATEPVEGEGDTVEAQAPADAAASVAAAG